jgi:uncharacterized surface protein with fasciclin (FAS1) repeats
MLFSINYKKTFRLTIAAFTLLVFYSCNKEFDKITSNQIGVIGGQTAGDLIDSDQSFSILKAALSKAGMLATLKNPGSRFTVWAPDDAALTASGISLNVVNTLPASQLQSIFSYHIIPQALPASQIPTSFPNIQMPTLLPLSQTNPLVKMSIFPSRRDNSLFVNNIPVTQSDIVVANGVVHKVARLVAPPTQLIAQVLAADPELSFFRAAIARADSGQVGLNRLDSAMRFGLANLTVFAPDNDAVKQFLIGLGLPPVEAAFNFLPVQTVRGVVAYHLLGVRAFSVNLPSTTSPILTLLGGSPFPALTVDRSLLIPRLLGAGNGDQYANFLSVDKHAVNGVVHIIDRVLRPQ